MAIVEIRCPRCGSTSHMKDEKKHEYQCSHCGATFKFIDTTQSNVEKIQEAEIYVQRGWNLILSRRHKQALEFFNKAIELDPDNPKTWSGKGMALLLSIRAIEHQPPPFWTGVDVSEIVPEHMKEAEEALRCLQKACEVGGALFDSLHTAIILRKLALKLGGQQLADEIIKGL